MTSQNNGSSVFTVAPSTLESYPEFFRIRQLRDARNRGIRPLLGLAEVAWCLGFGFAAQIVGDDSHGLLSRRHLRNIHNRLGSGGAALRIAQDIPTLVRDALEPFPCEIVSTSGRALAQHRKLLLLIQRRLGPQLKLLATWASASPSRIRRV